MILLKLTDRYLNLDHLVDAAIREGRDQEGFSVPTLILTFTAVIGSSIASTNSITLRGDDAATVLGWLEARVQRDQPPELGPEHFTKPVIEPWPALIAAEEGVGLR
jgi:hypothetical protein